MNSRRKFVKQTALVATALLAAKPFKIFAGSHSIFTSTSGGNSISVLHTADLLGHLSPVSNESLYNGLGGFQNLAPLIKQLRNKLPNVILADAGNFLHAEYSNSHTQELLGLAKQLKYDAVFMKDENPENLQTAVNTFQLPVVNSDSNNTNSLPYRIIQKGKIKIAIISVARKSFFTANKLAKKMKEQEQCNLVVCLSSLGYNNRKRLNDITLAERSTHIDIILGSESRSFMSTPHIVDNKLKNEVIINHVGYGGVVLGKLDIHFDEQGNKRQVVFDNLMIGTAGNRWRRATA